MAISVMDLQDIEADQIIAQHGPFVMTATGVIVTGPASYDEWSAATVWAQAVDHYSAFWVGDLLNYGEAAYGEKYAQAIEATGYKVGTLMNIASVAQKIPPEQRHPDLSFAHHQEVAPLPVVEQQAWLDKAELEGWSSKDLRHQLHVSKAQDAGQELLLGLWVKCETVEDQETLATSLKAAGRIVKLTSKPIT